MKNLILFILLPMAVSAQVQINKPLELTGSGMDARVMGIDTAVLGTDAVNLNMLQSSMFRYAESSGGSNGQYFISLYPWSGPTKGMILSFKADHTHRAIETNTLLFINGVMYTIIFNAVSEPNYADKIIDSGTVVTVVFSDPEFQFIF